MNSAKWLLSSLMVICTIQSLDAQELVLYKEIDTTQLYLEVHYPPSIDTSSRYPAMIFFFGGGWNGGNRHHFLAHAQYFSQRGLVCLLADYRIHKVHQTTPFESLKDAKSAMRYIRQHAADLHVDPDRIIASGGSAGGHLAAATAVIEHYNENSDPLSISCVPNALVLFNPVIDNGPAGYGFERIGNEYPYFSPLHNLKVGTPPTIMFLGTEDPLIPVATAKYYRKVMERIGSECRIYLYEGEKHGFFNYGNEEFYKDTVEKTDQFLQSKGFLSESIP